MVFSSSVFMLMFLPICLVGYYLLKQRKYKNAFLLVMSLLFYAWGEPRFAILMVISILVNYTLAIIIAFKHEKNEKPREVLIVAIAWNIGLLFVFKYLSFVLENLNKVIPNVPIISISLPIGISFFTFQALSYVIDVYRKKCKVQTSLLDLALYIAFFPQLVAGPIVMYGTIEKQLRERKESLEMFSDGVKRFIIGLVKKSILANEFAVISDRVFTKGTTLSLITAWIGIICYTFQIYYDFSGYSDMAIGLGKMFGFEFLENFNYPYVSKSIREYWRRWHISLGAWFKEYVYYPVLTSKWLANTNQVIKKRFGRNAVKKTSVIIPLLITWMATGIWHGASWNYIIWGVYYSLIIIGENVFWGKSLEKKPHIVQYFYVFTILILARVMVKTNSLSEFINYISALLSIRYGVADPLGVIMWQSHFILILLGVVFSAPTVPFMRGKIMASSFGKSILEYLEPLVYFLMFICAMSFILNGSYNPFIYFNF